MVIMQNWKPINGLTFFYLSFRSNFSMTVTTKVTQGAKTFGSFLYSAVNKAGAKIKETVKDNVSFLCSFMFEALPKRPIHLHRMSFSIKQHFRFTFCLCFFHSFSCRIFWANSIRNKKHLSKGNRIFKMALFHGPDIKMRTKSKKKFLICLPWVFHFNFITFSLTLFSSVGHANSFFSNSDFLLIAI